MLKSTGRLLFHGFHGLPGDGMVICQVNHWSYDHVTRLNIYIYILYIYVYLLWVHQVACHGGCAFWMTLLERFNYHSIWHCFELISGVGKFSWTGNETTKERLVKPHFSAVKCLVLLQEIPYGWSCSPHFCCIRLGFCCFKHHLSWFLLSAILVAQPSKSLVNAWLRRSRQESLATGAERPDGGCTKKAGHMKFELERIHILSTYGTIFINDY